MNDPVREAADTVREIVAELRWMMPHSAARLEGALDVLVAAAERADTAEEERDLIQKAYDEERDRAEAAEAKADTLEAALAAIKAEVDYNPDDGTGGWECAKLDAAWEIARAALAAAGAADSTEETG